MPKEITRRTLVKGIAASSVTTLAGCNSPTSESPPESDPESSPQPNEQQPDQQPALQIEEYPRVKIGSLEDIGSEPLDFEYPLEGQTNFAVKLGEKANAGVGPDDDIVAFTYKCAHMGCSLEGTYKDEYNMIGACPCHLSRFDLTNYGMTVTGHATQSLPQILLEVDENDDVYATGVMGLIYGYRDNLEDGEPSQAVKEALGVAGEGGNDDSSGSSGEDSSSANFGGWFENVGNFDGVVDKTESSNVTVTVGAQGNNGAFAFAPPAIRVSSGTTVTWEWTGDGGDHNVKAEDGSFESQLTGESGFTFEQTFDESGTIKYVCTPHKSLGMKGAVIVE